MKNAGAFAGFQHAERLVGIAPERLGDEHRFARLGSRENRVSVKVVRNGDNNDVNVGSANGLLEAGRVVWNVPFGGKRFGSVPRAREDSLDSVAASMAMKAPSCKIGRSGRYPALQYEA